MVEQRSSISFQQDGRQKGCQRTSFMYTEEQHRATTYKSQLYCATEACGHRFGCCEPPNIDTASQRNEGPGFIGRGTAAMVVCFCPVSKSYMLSGRFTGAKTW